MMAIKLMRNGRNQCQRIKIYDPSVASYKTFCRNDQIYSVEIRFFLNWNSAFLFNHTVYIHTSFPVYSYQRS